MYSRCLIPIPNRLRYLIFEKNLTTFSIWSSHKKEGRTVLHCLFSATILWRNSMNRWALYKYRVKCLQPTLLLTHNRSLAHWMWLYSLSLEKSKKIKHSQACFVVIWICSHSPSWYMAPHQAPSPSDTQSTVSQDSSLTDYWWIHFTMRTNVLTVGKNPFQC